MQQAWEEITELRQAHPVVDWQSVFLAPEYFFSNRRDQKDRFHSHDTKRFILKGLAELSAGLPKLLIVPGTVLWTKELFDQTSDGPVMNDTRLNKARARNQYARATLHTAQGDGVSPAI